jgi:hypothetical protein
VAGEGAIGAAAPEQQIRRGDKRGGKINILNKEIDNLHSIYFKLLSQMKKIYSSQFLLDAATVTISRGRQIPRYATEHHSPI